MRQYLTPSQLAEKLQVSIDTVQRHRDAWGAVRVGGRWRFIPEVVEERIQATARIPHQPRSRQHMIRVPRGPI